MRSQHARPFSRRRFLGRLSLAGTAGLLGLRPAPVAADPPPETRRIRLIKITGICVASQYVADDLLYAESFTDVEYVPATAGIEAAKVVGSGAADITMNFVAPTLMRVDAGDPLFLLAGVHVGCFELFVTERIRSIRDLRGKTVAVQALESSQHVFLASMAGAPPPRGRYDPVESAEAHCPGHGLALPHRAQEGAERVTEEGCFMP